MTDSFSTIGNEFERMASHLSSLVNGTADTTYDLVCCIHCRLVYPVHELSSGFHASRCEVLWEARQALYKDGPGFCTACSYCSRPVYSLRFFPRRACFKCAQSRRNAATRRSRQRRKAIEDIGS